MKILAPVKNLLSGIELVKAGAQELYFGVVSSEWEDKHKFTTILNRRDGRLANISSYKDAKKLVDFARKNNVKTYITLNNSPIIDDANLIKEEIKNSIAIKPDALIVKDIFIADLIRQIDKKIPIHCSSLNQTLNKYAIDFWVKNYNISRMIFPRNISINEIKELCASFPELEFEVFIKNDWCYNSDGVCSSLHLEGLKEGIPYVCNREVFYKSKDESLNLSFFNLMKNTLDCKICMLWELKDIPNLVSLKIVGREKGVDIILKDLKLIEKSLEYLSLADFNKEFADFNIKTSKKLLSKDCSYENCEIYNNYLK